jgi:hypothetical protein
MPWRARLGLAAATLATLGLSLAPRPAGAAAPPFTVVPGPRIAGATGLNGVTARSATEAWAVGSFTSPQDDFGLAALTQHWDGTAWTVVPASDTLRNDDVLAGVAEVGPTDVWAVGHRKRTGAKSPQKPMALHWNGSAWADVPVAPTADTRALLTGVAAVSSTDVWAVGRTGTVPLVQHWNGQAWSIVPAPVPAGATGVTSLAGVSTAGPKDVWAVGSWMDAAGNGRTLVEHWDGTAWRIVPSADVPPPRAGARAADHLDAVTAVAPDDVWAVGARLDTVTGSNLDDRTVIEHWDGTRWTVVPSPSPFDHDRLKAVAARSATEVWAFGDGYDDQATTVPVATQIILRWDGRTWTRVASPNVGTTDNLLNGAAAAPDIVWAVGRAYPDGTLTLAHK